MKVKSIYGTTQEMLYTICNAGWDLCSRYLPQFTNLKAFYTDSFVANALTDVSKAQALPDVRETVSTRKAARIKLVEASRVVMDNWQLLKVYITRAYSESLVDTMLEQAGASLYKKATVDNWSALRSLIEAGNSFIGANLSTLTDNENMPPVFQTTFLNDGSVCLDLSVTFFDTNLSKVMATNKKLNANNAIYENVIEMMKDGQQIFKADEATKKLFTFSFLLSLHQGEGSSSLTGYITNDMNLPVQGALIESADGVYSANTNAKGYYRINRMAAGIYAFTISCPGYSPLEQVVTLTAGTTSRVNVTLENVMKQVA